MEIVEIFHHHHFGVGTILTDINQTMMRRYFLLISFAASNLLASSFSLHRNPCYARDLWSLKSSVDTATNFNESKTTSSTAHNQNHDDPLLIAKVPETMQPLSRPPLLLLKSSSPIITKEGCELLIRHFRRNQSNISYGECDQQIDHTCQSAQKLLKRIHDIVDEVTGCPRHAGETSPRFVRYEPQIATVSDMAELEEDLLLPDGLHVDTNNGKLFRHITAILYLTDSDGNGLSTDDQFRFSLPIMGGATTFPLASGKQSVELNAAKNLLNRGIHHTRADCDNGEDSDGRILEKAGMAAFWRDNNQLCSGSSTCNDIVSEKTAGIRVMPQAGSLIYFHNVGDDGRPDPYSFHGGEELISLSTQKGDEGSRCCKSILVFFKEVPLESFCDEKGFAEQAAKARKWTLDEYY